MNTSKLKEALLELKAQRTVLDGAIASLEKIITMMNGESETYGISPTATLVMTKRRKSNPSYIDFAVSVLRNHNKPMSTKDLTYEVTKLKGKEVKRVSLEATLFKHIRTSKEDARIEKLGPGYYGLPSWPQETKDLWSQLANK